MSYLLAKFALIFLLATVLGMIFGYWWCRRRFVDVSENYEMMKSASQRNDDGNWRLLWARLDAQPEPAEVNLTGIEARLTALAQAVNNLPAPKTLDLGEFNSELGQLRR